MVLDANGNLGIGTAIPVAELQLQGKAIITDYTGVTAPLADLFITKTSDPYVIIDDDTASRVLSLGSNASGSQIAVNAGDLELKTGINWMDHPSTSGNTRMLISGTTGNVGIGTNNPETALQVANGKLAVSEADSAWGMLQLGNPTTP